MNGYFPRLCHLHKTTLCCVSQYVAFFVSLQERHIIWNSLFSLSTNKFSDKKRKNDNNTLSPCPRFTHTTSCRYELSVRGGRSQTAAALKSNLPPAKPRLERNNSLRVLVFGLELYADALEDDFFPPVCVGFFFLNISCLERRVFSWFTAPVNWTWSAALNARWVHWLLYQYQGIAAITGVVTRLLSWLS